MLISYCTPIGEQLHLNCIHYSPGNTLEHRFHGHQPSWFFCKVMDALNWPSGHKWPWEPEFSNDRPIKVSGNVEVLDGTYICINGIKHYVLIEGWDAREVKPYHFIITPECEWARVKHPGCWWPVNGHQWSGVPSPVQQTDHVADPVCQPAPRLTPLTWDHCHI